MSGVMSMRSVSGSETVAVAELEVDPHLRTKSGQNPDNDAGLRERGWLPGQIEPDRAARMQELSARRRDHQDGPPPAWDAGWVEVRYIAAFRTVLSMPIPTGPKSYGSNWPAILHEFEDHVGQVSTGELGKGRNRVVRGAPIEEIAAMEKVFEWALTVMRPYPFDSKLLQAWAFFRALGRDPDWLAERLKLTPRTMRRRRRQAASLCAARLNKASVRPF